MRSLGWRLTPAAGRRAARRPKRAPTAAIAGRWRAGWRRTSPSSRSPSRCCRSSGATACWAAARIAVLMTRLPMAALQARLERRSPRTRTAPRLADYRAEPWLAAGREPRRWPPPTRSSRPTPRSPPCSASARGCWMASPAGAGQAAAPGDVFAFPGPTVARKGAFEVREAARRLGAKRAAARRASWRVRTSGPASRLDRGAGRRPGSTASAPWSIRRWRKPRRAGCWRRWPPASR